MNESGWSFQKKYTDYRSALDSLSDYLKLLREQKTSMVVKKILTPEMTEDSIRRLLEDIQRKTVFLPDGGKGYKYPD
jgi:flagellum-specific peptidoglycan hydrolase FlgJ